jgi:hypothetical protein
MEFLSQFDAKNVYIRGEDNSVADRLLCLRYDADSADVDSSAQHPYSSVRMMTPCALLPAYHCH